MDFARIYELHNFFSNRRYPVPTNDILAEFNYSKSTFHVIRRYMCDYLGAPIKNKRGQGYYYDIKAGEIFELPGLWFNSKEIIALALFEQLSAGMQPELVKNLLTPIGDRLEALLQKQNISTMEWKNRLKVIGQWQRSCEPGFFMNITQALLARRQLQISYWKWSSNETGKRIISPQRLVYYRDNWYLDAWCHLTGAIKTFSVDAIRKVKNLPDPAHEIDADELDVHVTEGYGIFAGKAEHMAQLKFSGPIAARIRHQNWHPEQQSQWTDNGEYLLQIPYSQPHELIRDILSFGSNAEVLAPEKLKQALKEELEKALKKYR